MAIVPFLLYIQYYLLLYKPLFTGSNFLYASGPFCFIIDKEKIAKEVEVVMTRLMSMVTGEKTDYNLDERPKKQVVQRS